MELLILCILLQIIDSNMSEYEESEAEHDWIIIGAGSAGCVVASRLSEVPSERVLLIEAGRDENILTDIPLLVSYILATDYNWHYRTQSSKTACLAMNWRRCKWSRGRALGGTSVVNYMVYNRGFPQDYDLWAKLGNEEHPKWRTPLADAFLESAKALNYTVGHTEAFTTLGMTYVFTNTLNGARLSTNKAYLRRNKRRKNLKIETLAKALKVIIDPKTKLARSVEYLKDGKVFRASARKEIILSAGSINTPQLLMLSGIGPKEHLQEHGIKVISDLPGVGQNLQDHVSMAGLAFLINDTVSIIDERLLKLDYFFDYVLRGDGPYTLPGGAEALGFIETKYNTPKGHPDIELVFGPGALTGDTGGSLRVSFNLNETISSSIYGPYEGRDAFNIVPVLLKPYSRGQIKLASKDPMVYPRLYHNYYKDERDLKTMVQGIRQAIKIGLGKGFQKYGSYLMPMPISGCKHIQTDSDQYWACIARYFTTNLQHMVGTAKMGPIDDRLSVVDNRLKVKTIRNLRVIDGSIMPIIPAGHTHAIIVMIGEKGADMIKQDWNL